MLASGSAVRRLLLEAAGLAVTVRPSDLDEQPIKEACRARGLPAGDAASALARAKAERVSASDPAALVIGADQILCCAGRWFDKPRDRADARRHLGLLAGQRIELATAVVLARSGQVVWQHVGTPVVRMRASSAPLLDAYAEAEGASLLETVGACRLEGRGQLLVEALDGEHAAMLGLPMLPLLAALRAQGVLQD